MLLRHPFAPRDVVRPGTPNRIPSLLADVVVLLGTLALMALIARIGAGAFVRFVPPHDVPTVSLDPRYLPYYAARSTLRMVLALGASLLFSLLYPTFRTAPDIFMNKMLRKSA
jgi:NitT/TauT family transport system permease protein